jgi:signal transduction histidine kinase
MFYRASEKSDGAGLGLYIANEIVVKLKGTISIDSQLGKGTTVTIVIPNETSQIHHGT